MSEHDQRPPVGVAHVGIAQRMKTALAVERPHLDDPLARLDCRLNGELIASWYLSSPRQELIRATASGPHSVLVVDRPVLKDGNEALVTQVLQHGVPIFAPAATQAMLQIMD